MVEKQRKLSSTGIIAGLVLVAGAAYLVQRHYQTEGARVAIMRSAQAKVAEDGPRVEVIKAGAGPDFRTIKLLGDVKSSASVTLYAKVSGYLKSIAVDKGDIVSAGQIIAELESPELEQQLAASTADLMNKRRNLERLRGLYERGSTTQVLMLQSETDALVSENNVAVLSTTKSYLTIRAPLDGRVISRFMDPGSLVTNAQTNSVSATPIVTISNNSRIRVYAYLQQHDVPFIKVGHKAEISDASRPERRRSAEVTRMTGEIDSKSRTMLIEAHLDNPDDFFTPGSFVNMSLQVPLEKYIQIPATALLVRQAKTFVAAVDQDRVRFRPIIVAGTDGAQIAVSKGVAEGDVLVINLPDEVTDGDRVQPVAPRR
jgi:RND family efflux transporter MFP subunit